MSLLSEAKTRKNILFGTVVGEAVNAVGSENCTVNDQKKKKKKKKSDRKVEVKQRVAEVKRQI